MDERADDRVATSRGGVLGQVLICDGCCCGRVERGFPAVPRDWLKSQWKAQKLNRHVQLTMSGCLGPCDVANVVAILTPQDCIWLGELTREDQYAELLGWASQSAERGMLQPLPPALQGHVFQRFEASAPPAACASAAGEPAPGTRLRGLDLFPPRD